jgi:hypothetical protein
MWMSQKIFLLPGIFPLKIEKHFKKISQKNYAERVLNLLLARRSGASAGEKGKPHLTAPRALSPIERQGGRNAGTSGFLPLADMTACPINVPPKRTSLRAIRSQ